VLVSVGMGMTPMWLLLPLILLRTLFLVRTGVRLSVFLFGPRQEVMQLGFWDLGGGW
jgi:hypothetical protein